MSDKGFTLKWEGGKVVNICEDQLKAILAETGLTAEGESKKELRKGHGVKTGTLRRSIHVANPDYDFSADDVKSAKGTPERGGKSAEPKQEDKHRFVLALGSGLKYALKIHQGWGSFKGYHYITNGVDKTRKQLGTIVGRHKV